MHLTVWLSCDWENENKKKTKKKPFWMKEQVTCTFIANIVSLMWTLYVRILVTYVDFQVRVIIPIRLHACQHYVCNLFLEVDNRWSKLSSIDFNLMNWFSSCILIWPCNDILRNHLVSGNHLVLKFCVKVWRLLNFVTY